MPARRTPLDLLQLSMLLTLCALTFAFAVLIAFVADHRPSNVRFEASPASERFDLTLVASQEALRPSSPGLGAAMLSGFLLAIPPLLVLAWLWARLLPYVVHRVPGSVLTGLGILLESVLLLPLAPAFPASVARGLGYPGADRGETGTSPWFLVGLGPVYAFGFLMWIGKSYTLQSRLVGAAVFALYAGAYAAALFAEHWRRKNWLAAPAPPVVNFSLRAMMLAFVSFGAYASMVALIFR